MSGRKPTGGLHASVRQTLVEQFATVHSLALQQSLWEMGSAALAAHPVIAEIRLSAPNKHHFLVDLRPFGLDNRGRRSTPTIGPTGSSSARCSETMRRPLAQPGMRLVRLRKRSDAPGSRRGVHSAG